MILVRNVFRLKYGQAKPALALWKEGMALAKKANPTSASRLLTDLVGPSYTLVFEDTYKDLSSLERIAQSAMHGDEWRAWYQKFVPLVDSGCREIFTIVE
jgi:hypothetical protein